MKTKLIATLMLAAGSMFAGPRVFFGVSVGAPAPVVAYATPCPGPGYVWVNGFYTYASGRQVWNAGYWRAPVIVSRPIIERREFVEHRDFDRRHDFDRRDFDRHRDFDRGFRR